MYLRTCIDQLKIRFVLHMYKDFNQAQFKLWWILLWCIVKNYLSTEIIRGQLYGTLGLHLKKWHHFIFPQCGVHTDSIFWYTCLIKMGAVIWSSVTLYDGTTFVSDFLWQRRAIFIHEYDISGVERYPSFASHTNREFWFWCTCVIINNYIFKIGSV